MRHVAMVFAAILMACTVPPPKTDVDATPAPMPVSPMIEIHAPREHHEREKPVKPSPKRVVVPAAPEPPDPCANIEAPDLKDEIHSKLDCLVENPK